MTISATSVQNQITNAAWANSPVPTTVAPGEIVTLTTIALNVPDATATQFPLPTSLSGVSVNVRVVGSLNATGYPTSLPILSIRSVSAVNLPNGGPCSNAPPNVVCSGTSITVQIPTEGVCQPSQTPTLPCSVTNYLPSLLLLNVVANGVTGADFPVFVAQFYPHALDSCDAVFGPGPFAKCYPLITHADGSLVEVAASTSPAGSSPARVGETITIYAVGLGVPVPGVPPTGTAPAAPIALPPSTLDFSYQYPISAASSLPGGAAANSASSITHATPIWVGLVPGYVGLYQINVIVPAAPSGSYPACELSGNASVTASYRDGGVVICVQP